MVYLRELRIDRTKTLPASYPFNISVIKALQKISFESEVTLFVGENGSGKSTLLEGIGAACDLPIVGSRNMKDDATLTYAYELARYLRLSWSLKQRKGFFLRAEDFFGFTKRLNRLREELIHDREHFDSALPQGLGHDLAVGSISGQIQDLEQRYGVDLSAQSHGESFLQLFQSRIKPGGLYLLDEPETPLSPIRQLALVKLISESVSKKSQFIIATHSPVLMAYPKAVIYDFNEGTIQETSFSQINHVQLLKDFLNNPERFINQVIRED